MTSAYILVAAVLILGGVLATLGDRLGSKVGKARLRLFNLRPRQTAVVITVVTGVLISGSTLGLLFALSKSLRQGIFQLDQILTQRLNELNAVVAEKEAAETALAKARSDRQEMETALEATSDKFQLAQKQLKNLAKEVLPLRSEIKTLREQRQQLAEQKQGLMGQISQRDQQLSDRQTQLEALTTQQETLQGELNTRDQDIRTLDQQIAAKDQQLQSREQRLKELEVAMDGVRREVIILQEYYDNYQALRAGDVVITRGQVLASGVFRLRELDEAVQVIDTFLAEANRQAIQMTQPPSNQNFSRRVLRISTAQVEQIVEQLNLREEYVLRIVSAGNYVEGETGVRVFADFSPNERIFRGGDIVARYSPDRPGEGNTTNGETPVKNREIVEYLLTSTQFRARRAGLLGDIQIENGATRTWIDFLERLENLSPTIEEVRAIAQKDSYSSGPLSLRILVFSQGKVILSSEMSVS